MTSRVDVLVVGAGLAGLSAARRLKAAGLEVRVLEARNRVGGRVYTQHFGDGTYLDLGAQWIGPTQDRCYELASEFGLEWFGTYNQGRNLLALAGAPRAYSGLIPRMDPLSLLNMELVMRRLERMARRIDLERPWLSPGAEQFDGCTLASFLDRQVPLRAARQVLDAGLETLFAASPAELSLLHALFYIKSGTSLNGLLSIEGGAQQHRLKGGAQLLADRLAEPLGSDVQLNAPVGYIRQSPEGVEVSGHQFSLSASRLIVALPPVMAARINYEPALPGWRDQLLQRIPMGTVIKCYALYDRPWWREQGWSGQVVAGDRYCLQTVFDNSPADGSRGMLMGFSLAGRARRLLRLSAEDRRGQVLGDLARFFGPAAARVDEYIDHSWADEVWSRGCYTGLFSPGAWTGFQDALRRPIGFIHWAGTETSPVWNGYMEGAIRSGERAAEEVLEWVGKGISPSKL